MSIPDYGALGRGDRAGIVTDSMFDGDEYLGDASPNDDPALNNPDPDGYQPDEGRPLSEVVGDVATATTGGSTSDPREDAAGTYGALARGDRAGAVTDSIFGDSGYIGSGNSPEADPATGTPGADGGTLSSPLAIGLLVVSLVVSVVGAIAGTTGGKDDG